MSFVHRLIKKEEEVLLRDGLCSIDRSITNYDDTLRRRRYFHLYKQPNTSDMIGEDLHQRFMRFAARLRSELLEASLIESTDELSHYGYMISFPAAPEQEWHIDYDGDVVIIYIPLTRETEKNATQYLKQNEGYSLLLQFLSATHEEIPLIYTPRHSMHRGIENGEDFRRAVFYFMYAKRDWQSLEPLFEETKRLAVNVDALTETHFLPEDEAPPQGAAQEGARNEHGDS